MPGVPVVPPGIPGVLVGAPTDMLRVYCSADSSRRKTLELRTPSILLGEWQDGEEIKLLNLVSKEEDMKGCENFKNMKGCEREDFKIFTICRPLTRVGVDSGLNSNGELNQNILFVVVVVVVVVIVNIRIHNVDKH